MSDSDRGERDQALDQGLGVLVAIILCCLIVGVITFSWGRDSERDSQRAAEYQDYGERRERAFCADLAGALLAKCQIEQEQAAREAYQTQRDLEAQRDMSLWALAVFIIGAVTAGLTLWALWYVRGTLIATREALEDTGNATKAMVRQNELSERLQRPWLQSRLVTKFDPKAAPGGLLFIILEFQNSSAVPALRVAPATHFFFLEPGAPLPGFERPDVSQYRTAVIAPGAARAGPHFELSGDKLKSLVTGKGRVAAYAFVAYSGPYSEDVLYTEETIVISAGIWEDGGTKHAFQYDIVGPQNNMT